MSDQYVTWLDTRIKEEENTKHVLIGVLSRQLESQQEFEFRLVRTESRLGALYECKRQYLSYTGLSDDDIREIESAAYFNRTKEGNSNE
jgi:hypothetical protein